MLQQETPLKVLVRMKKRIQLGRRPEIFILNLLNLPLMRVLENAVTRDMVALLLNVVPDLIQRLALIDARALQHLDQVIGGEGAVRAAMALARAGEGLSEEFLARVRGVAAAAAVSVAADVAVGVADVVDVFFFEFFLFAC